jgi:hypothetical protein
MSIFENKEPESASVMGQTLECAVCQHTKFWQRHAQLHSAIATFFNVEWANPTARCYICASCGYIYWFLPPKDQES